MTGDEAHSQSNLLSLCLSDLLNRRQGVYHIMMIPVNYDCRRTYVSAVYIARERCPLVIALSAMGQTPCRNGPTTGGIGRRVCPLVARFVTHVSNQTCMPSICSFHRQKPNNDLTREGRSRQCQAGRSVAVVGLRRPAQLTWTRMRYWRLKLPGFMQNLMVPP